jgi:hypothetical protein
MVVYEGMVDASGKLDEKNPLDVYWLDIDPEYVEKARKAGRTDDRVDLNVLEKKMAYGSYVDKDASTPDKIVVKLVALPKRLVTITVVDGKPVSKLEISGAQAIVKKIYVHAVDRRFNPLPKVEYVDVFGVDDAGNVVSERLTP